MSEEKALVPKPTDPSDVIATAVGVENVLKQVEMVHDCMSRAMKDNVHYGIIPGVKKPSLLQPGADLLNMMFRFAPAFEIISVQRNAKLVSYVVKCTLTHIPSGNRVSECIAACNTDERKYRYTMAKTNCDPMDLENTILKMAEKRAKVGATLNATAAFDIFTQDMEDVVTEDQMGKPERKPRRPEYKKKSKEQLAKDAIAQMNDKFDATVKG